MTKQLKNIVVLGGGESGIGAALLATTQGIQVFLSDAGKIKEDFKKELKENNIAFEEENHDLDKILNSEAIIKSPGIPNNISVLKAAVENGVSILSEIEFASRYTRAKLIGITGTNGKTTTTNLTYYILKQAGFNVKMAGNIGNSFAREVALDGGKTEYFVLEISSFQLDHIEQLKLHLSVLLNITPDHLDRYSSLADYIKAKLKIANLQTEEDSFIYNKDDENINKYLDKVNQTARFIPFSQEEKLENGAFIHHDQLYMNMDNLGTRISLENFALLGKHNKYNGMAASIVAKALNIKKEIIRESLETYNNVEHRLEHVASIKKVEYINDSKATNVNAAWYALESMSNTTIWIAGGVDKGNDYSTLAELVDEKVRVLICLGKDNDNLKKSFSNKVDLVLEAGSMKEAVEMAYKISEQNETVLLSPACASFDLFENYEDRGEQFKNQVRSL